MRVGLCTWELCINFLLVFLRHVVIELVDVANLNIFISCWVEMKRLPPRCKCGRVWFITRRIPGWRQPGACMAPRFSWRIWTPDWGSRLWRPYQRKRVEKCAPRLMLTWCPLQDLVPLILLSRSCIDSMQIAVRSLSQPTFEHICGSPLFDIVLSSGCLLTSVGAPDKYWRQSCSSHFSA